MNENISGLGKILSDRFKEIKDNNKDWFHFVPQSEVMEKLRTSHTQLNRWIGEFPSKIRKYKMNRKVYYKKSDINGLIEYFGSSNG